MQGAATFRFTDSREKFLLFTATCSEKQETAQRIGAEFEHLRPRPPALHLYQAGAEDGTLLNMVLRDLHHRWPTLPVLAVVRELNPELIRLAARNLADRFREHPDLVLVLTDQRADEDLAGPPAAVPEWHEQALEGAWSHDFEAQINRLLDFVQERWSAAGGTRHVLVLYRADHRFILDGVIPRRDAAAPRYDVVIAAQAYRSRLPAAHKVERLLAPLATRLAPGGRMIVVQSTGRDPGMRIIRALWPREEPFPTPRAALLEALRERLAHTHPDLRFVDPPQPDAEFRFHLRLNPEDVQTGIGTSTLLAAWNAAVYVAQIDDARLTEAMTSGEYLRATERVLRAHRALWFANECFLVTREGP